jgi:hypothetical protein
MANIPIEKKGGGFPLVPVIVGLLVVLALVFFLVRGFDDNDPATSDGLIEDTLTQDPDAGLGPNDTDSIPGVLQGDADNDGDSFEPVDPLVGDTTR